MMEMEVNKVADTMVRKVWAPFCFILFGMRWSCIIFLAVIVFVVFAMFLFFLLLRIVSLLFVIE